MQRLGVWGSKQIFQIKIISNMMSHCLNPCFHSSNMNLHSSNQVFRILIISAKSVLSTKHQTCFMLPANSQRHMVQKKHNISVLKPPEPRCRFGSESSQHVLSLVCHSILFKDIQVAWLVESLCSCLLSLLPGCHLAKL